MPPMERPPAHIAPSRASLSGGISRQPLLANHGEHLSRKTSEEAFLFESHPDLFGDATRWSVVAVDDCYHPRQFQIAKCVITHFSRRFGGDPSYPVISMMPISNFHFFLAVNVLN